MKGVTTYQLEILKHVAAAPAGEPLDFDQLLEMLSWTPSKESAQFPIRSLVQKKLLKKGELVLRRGRKRVTYLLTEEGEKVLDPRGSGGTDTGSRSGGSETKEGENEKGTGEGHANSCQKAYDEDFGSQFDVFLE